LIEEFRENIKTMGATLVQLSQKALELNVVQTENQAKYRSSSKLSDTLGLKSREIEEEQRRVDMDSLYGMMPENIIKRQSQNRVDEDYL
jgi:hypothetical protein